jgi:hypothetical protein
MDVFCSEAQRVVLDRSPDAAPRVLPLPGLVDSSVVVLLHLLLRDQWARPVVLDASALREICPVAALLLAATLDARCRHGAPVQVVRLGFEIRRRLDSHPLLRFVQVPMAASPPRATSPHGPEVPAPPLAELQLHRHSVTGS